MCLAERAQRHAVPILEDLIGAVRSDQVRDMFDRVKLHETSELASQIFERYITDLIRRFPTLNAPTRLDFGPARVIVLDLHHVAPKGSAAADRQTEMMYLLARHILARNFFLHPDYLPFVPEAVRPYHAIRFLETSETVKRIDYDEWHRTQGSPIVLAQAERDVREGRKHNVQLGFTSQRPQDIHGGIASQATGVFILGAGDRGDRDELIKRFDITEAGAKIVRHRLTGPRKEGAPFLAIFRAEAAHYEQFLVNSLGPVELWALSTTPADTALRNRLYDRVGFSEGLRRLSVVFPNGSASVEVERRTKALSEERRCGRPGGGRRRRGAGGRTDRRPWAWPETSAACRGSQAGAAANRSRIGTKKCAPFAKHLSILSTWICDGGLDAYDAGCGCFDTCSARRLCSAGAAGADDSIDARNAKSGNRAADHDAERA